MNTAQPHSLLPALLLGAACSLGLLAACGDSSGVGGGLAGGGSSSGSPVSGSSKPLKIEVLSNRADLLSSGNALVRITHTDGSLPQNLSVTLGGKDVSAQFARRANGQLEAVVQGLANGSNLLVAKNPDGSGAALTLTNHPQGGPVLTGAQLQPWVCGTVAAGLGEPLDAQCNAPTKFQLFYRSRVTQSFAAYNPASPPSDLATTTTDEGKTLPYIVRVEHGTMNRGLYKLAVLHDPAKPWTPWEKQAGWNGKLMWLFGGGTAPHYSQDQSPDPLDDTALSRGYMVGSGGLNVHGNNSNDNTSAEVLMMMKEHIRENYGPIVFTIGEGCSGGGLQQHLIASMYPGLLDGLIPTCSYPDVWTTATEVAACVLMNRYFQQTSPQLWAALPQQAEVMGHSSIGPCLNWQQLFGERLNPSSVAGCNLPAAQVYNAATNPTGARCTISDHMVSVLGVRPPSVWTAVEKQIGRGFANRPVSAIGVQWGLTPLLAGLITAEQFVDLNEKIGGIDIDGQFETRRTPADPGVSALSYRAGLVSDARQLAKVAIIDLRGHDDAEIHTDDWSYVLRARLDRHNGGHGNQIIFTGPTPLFGDPAFACAGGFSAGFGTTGVSFPKEPCTHNPLALMDRWLTAVQADATALPLAQKIIANRPADAVDTCFINGAPVTNVAACRAVYPYYSNPVVQAGGPFATDNIECQLKALNRADYAAVLPAMSDAQFNRLKAVFPDGVCDWSKPSASDQPSVPWLTYKAGPGGQPLGAEPVSVPLAR